MILMNVKIKQQSKPGNDPTLYESEFSTLSCHFAIKLRATKSFNLGRKYSNKTMVEISIYCNYVTFQFSPLSFCPTTTFPYFCHYTIFVF